MEQTEACLEVAQGHTSLPMALVEQICPKTQLKSDKINFLNETDPFLIQILCLCLFLNCKLTG